MKNDDSSGLPLGVAAAWGLRERPAKGPKPGLSLERIVAAGVAVAQSEGLASVSMGKVAAEAGATAMALYRYVGNKDELLSLMTDSALGPPPEVPRPGQDWREGLTEWAWAENAAYRRNPWVLQLPIQGIPALPNQFAWMDRGLQCLNGVGGDGISGPVEILDDDEKLSVILLISSVVRSYSQIERGIAEAMAAAGSDPQQMMAAMGERFTLLVDPARFPALAAVVASGQFSKADPLDKELTFGLERALDGVAAMIASRS